MAIFTLAFSAATSLGQNIQLILQLGHAHLSQRPVTDRRALSRTSAERFGPAPLSFRSLLIFIKTFSWIESMLSY